MEVNEYSVPIENFKKKVNGKPVAVVGMESAMFHL